MMCMHKSFLINTAIFYKETKVVNDFMVTLNNRANRKKVSCIITHLQETFGKGVAISGNTEPHEIFISIKISTLQA